MPDETKEVKLPTPPVTEVINQVTHFVDNVGRQVSQFWPVEMPAILGSEPMRVGTPFYRGAAPIIVTTPQGTQQTNFGFQFPPEVTSVGEAFKRFDECIQAAIKEQERQQEEQHKKALAARNEQGKIIIPGTKPALNHKFQLPPGMLPKRHQ